MPIVASDIKYLYSGGTTNTNPNLSLGGEPSIYNVSNNLLFDNVTSRQAITGSVDYRCIYITNDNPTYNFYNPKIFIAFDTPGGADIQVGFILADDRQYVNITRYGATTGGTITLTYNDISSHNFTFSWDGTASNFASNFETAIRTIANLEDVEVSDSYNPSSDVLTFEVNFVGTSGQRYHEPLVLNANNLTFTGTSPNISIVKSVDGSPVNSQASPIDVETTPPTSVVFINGFYTFPSLRALDVIPVWIKRTTSANTLAMESDGFTVRIRGDAVLA
jgi:hypothetical protein